jgi:hypothetical protein
MSLTLLLLLVGLPPHPSSLRVRVWRRLKSLGAVPLKRSAYLLPDTPERYEDFQWLSQEIQRAGGEATLVRVQQIENMSEADVLQIFHEPRDRDYRQLAVRYRKLLQSLDKKKGGGARAHDELVKLSKDHQRIREIDFLDAPGGAEVRRLEEAITMRTRRPESPRPAPAPTLDISTLRGRQWVTRPRPHVDRIASAWLIKRFIDTAATFVFADPAAFPPDAIPFDARRGLHPPRRGLHVRDADQARAPARPPSRAARRDRARSGPARRKVSPRGGSRHRRRDPGAARAVAQ